MKKSIFCFLLVILFSCSMNNPFYTPDPPKQPLNIYKPEVDAGPDRSYLSGTPTNLEGSITNRSGSIVKTEWKLLSPASISMNYDESDLLAIFTTPENQTGNNIELIFELTATNSYDLTASDTVIITVLYDAEAPTANAGADQIVNDNTVVNLSGYGTNRDGGILNYQWTQIDGTPVSLTNPDNRNTSFIAPNNTSGSNISLTFELTVTNSDNLSATDQVVIIIMYETECNKFKKRK